MPHQDMLAHLIFLLLQFLSLDCSCCSPQVYTELRNRWKWQQRLCRFLAWLESKTNSLQTHLKDFSHQSNIGGYLGLYLGVSLLQVLPILNLIFSLGFYLHIPILTLFLFLLLLRILIIILIQRTLSLKSFLPSWTWSQLLPNNKGPII